MIAFFGVSPSATLDFFTSGSAILIVGDVFTKGKGAGGIYPPKQKKHLRSRTLGKGRGGEVGSGKKGGEGWREGEEGRGEKFGGGKVSKRSIHSSSDCRMRRYRIYSVQSTLI